MKNKDFR